MSEWIVSSPETLGGKPCIRGTRISVELIMELLADGATSEQILSTHPQVTKEGLAAAIEYAAHAAQDDTIALNPARKQQRMEELDNLVRLSEEARGYREFE